MRVYACNTNVRCCTRVIRARNGQAHLNLRSHVPNLVYRRPCTQRITFRRCCTPLEGTRVHGVRDKETGRTVISRSRLFHLRLMARGTGSCNCQVYEGPATTTCDKAPSNRIQKVMVYEKYCNSRATGEPRGSNNIRFLENRRGLYRGNLCTCSFVLFAKRSSVSAVFVSFRDDDAER